MLGRRRGLHQRERQVPPRVRAIKSLINWVQSRAEFQMQVTRAEARGYWDTYAKDQLSMAGYEIDRLTSEIREITPDEIAAVVRPVVNDLRRRIEYRLRIGQTTEWHEAKLAALLERFPAVQPAETPVMLGVPVGGVSPGLKICVQGDSTPVDLGEVHRRHEDGGYMAPERYVVVGFIADIERDDFVKSAPAMLRLTANAVMGVGRNFTVHAGERNETGAQRLRRLAQHVAVYQSLRERFPYASERFEGVDTKWPPADRWHVGPAAVRFAKEADRTAYILKYAKQ